MCDTLLKKPQGDVIARCPNTHCPGKHRESLYHFFGKKGFDVEALGEKIIDQLVDRSFILTPADIFSLTFDEIFSLDLFEKKRTENLLNALDHAKIISFPKFLFALGIRHIGEKTAQDMVPELQRNIPFQSSLFEIHDQKKFFEFTTPNIFIQNLLKNPHLREDLATLEGIGPKALESFEEWIFNKDHQKLLHDLGHAGVKILKEETSKDHDPRFSGKIFVITGSFSRFSREELKSIILRKGGKVGDQVSSKTSVLLCGENPGSKLKKAKELGVAVCDEKQVKSLFA